MATKLILLALVASFGVNGSPCKPHSFPSISSAITSDGAFATTTDELNTGSESVTRSSEYDFISTSLAYSLSTDETTSEIISTFSKISSDLTEASATTETGTQTSYGNTPTVTSDSTSTQNIEISATKVDSDASTSVVVSTLFTATDSTAERFTTTESEVVTSWSSEPASSSTFPSTTTTAAQQTPIGFYNGGFEDDPSPDGLPWVIGRGVTVPNDPQNARSGDRYALITYPMTGSGRPLYPLRQTVTGLDSTKKYLWTFHWAFADFGTLSNTRCTFYTYWGVLLEYSSFSAAGMPTNEYFERQYVVNRPSTFDSVDMLFHWQCSVANPSSPWDGVQLRVDDVSLVEYDPPCTVLDSPPSDLVCGETGSFAASANSYLIGSEIPLGPFETCAQMCAENSECKTFTATGGTLPLIGRNARCKLYSRSPEEIGFSRTTGGQSVYQPGCFECRPLQQA
ncbi:hypothetical protein FLONG3_6608 [Fusarium longipes]|uniref:Apple domain-containing protein n=1 Tax=Fusarium longipes TaxID=694270 RepID=A0A395SJJ1_9HYPO|nr:hypothetical protein FLONG3_6608 [Fusarium longipes]